MNKWLILLASGLVGVVGCGETVTKRPEPVEVTVTATGADGKPLPATAAVILQPVGDQMPTKLTSKDGGKFTGKAMPGKYMYYIGKQTGEGAPPGIPQKHMSASNDLTIEVPPTGGALDIKLSN